MANYRIVDENTIIIKLSHSNMKYYSWKAQTSSAPDYHIYLGKTGTINDLLTFFDGNAAFEVGFDFNNIDYQATEIEMKNSIMGPHMQVKLEFNIINRTQERTAIEVIGENYGVTSKHLMSALSMTRFNGIEIKKVGNSLVGKYTSFSEETDTLIEYYHSEEYIALMNFSKEVSKRRGIFRRAIINEFSNDLSIDIEPFILPERAHIVSVSECIQNNKMDWISNPDNGLNLDPNTHTLLDANKLKVNRRGEIYEFVWCDSGAIYSLINDEWLTAARKEFLNRVI